MNGQALELKGNEIEVSEQSYMQIVWCYERGDAGMDESEVEIHTVCSWQITSAWNALPCQMSWAKCRERG